MTDVNAVENKHLPVLFRVSCCLTHGAGASKGISRRIVTCFLHKVAKFEAQRFYPCREMTVGYCRIGSQRVSKTIVGLRYIGPWFI